MFITKTLCIAGAMFIAQQNSEPNTFPENYAVNVEMWWRQLPFIERINSAADAGFKHIEFWPWQGKDIDAIAKVCDERNIEVAIFLTIWFIASFYATTKGVRFVLQATPVLAIGLGAFMGITWDYATKWVNKELKLNKLLASSTIFLILMLLMIQPIQAGYASAYSS
ncbi:MAG: hypothetical protein HOJ00_08385, partial [Phycisphaerae bacterium]|nr:hypothetical protein [Phycisphaerae bacterium]